MHRTLLMSPKGLLSPRREKPTQKSLCSYNLAAGNRRMGPSLLIQLVTVSVPTGCAEQSWSAEEGGNRRARHISYRCRYQHRTFWPYEPTLSSSDKHLGICLFNR